MFTGHQANTQSVRNRYHQQSQGTKEGLRDEKMTWPNHRPKALQQWNVKPRKPPLISVLSTHHCSPVTDEVLLEGQYPHTCHSFPTQKIFLKIHIFSLSVNSLASNLRPFEAANIGSFVLSVCLFVSSLFYTYSQHVPLDSNL